MDPGALSRILAGKQDVSVKICKKILKKLDWSKEQQRLFLLSVAFCKEEKIRRKLGAQIEVPDLLPQRLELDAETFRKLANIHCMAITEYSFLEEHEATPEWISRRLGISVSEAQAHLDALVQAGLIRIEDNRMTKLYRHLTAGGRSNATEAHRENQRQILAKALQSVDKNPIETRCMMGMTMAIDSTKLEEARMLIQEFAEKLSGLLETGHRTQIYQLGIQLFPLEKGE